MTAEIPTPPSPTTATASPGRTTAVLRTAPAPVRTAHPKTAATSSGTSSGRVTSERGETTVSSENAETPSIRLRVARPLGVSPRQSRVAVGAAGAERVEGMVAYLGEALAEVARFDPAPPAA